MIQVINGEITKYSLPKTGTLKDGSTVSGYHILDEDTLIDEGWLPLDEKEKPEYDSETQYLESEYEILKTKVNKVYKVVDYPEQEPDRIEELENIINEMLGVDPVE